MRSAAFGPAGPYVRMVGTAAGELDPADPARGNGVLLYDVTNRGRKFFLHWVQDAPQTSPSAVNDPTAPEHAGNGFALARGYTLVSSGWDPDAPKANQGMTIRVPAAAAAAPMTRYSSTPGPTPSPPEGSTILMSRELARASTYPPGRLMR